MTITMRTTAAMRKTGAVSLRLAWRAAAGVATIIVAVSSTATPAWAAPTTQVVQGQVLRLVSVADWDAASSLLPGDAVQWDVTVSASAPDPGIVRVGVSATGDAALVIDAAVCQRAWEPNGCPGGSTPIEAPREIPRDGVELPLLQSQDTDVMNLRLTIALGAPDAAGSTEVRVHAHGAGESVEASSTGELATTGMSQAMPGMLVGGVALTVLGLLVGAARRRRRVRTASRSES